MIKFQYRCVLKLVHFGTLLYSLCTQKAEKSDAVIEMQWSASVISGPSACEAWRVFCR